MPVPSSGISFIRNALHKKGDRPLTHCDTKVDWQIRSEASPLFCAKPVDAVAATNGRCGRCDPSFNELLTACLWGSLPGSSPIKTRFEEPQRGMSGPRFLKLLQWYNVRPCFGSVFILIRSFCRN